MPNGQLIARKADEIRARCDSSNAESILDGVLTFLNEEFYLRDESGKVIWKDVGKDGKSELKPLHRTYELLRFEEYNPFIAELESSAERLRRVIEISARCRDEQPPDVSGQNLENLVKIFKESRRALTKGYFGGRRVLKDGRIPYDGNDILFIDFLPQSCTSFCMLAYDLLAKLGVKSQIVGLPEPEQYRHSIIRYVGSDGKIRKCDPKWQKLPEFFYSFPEERKRFVEDPNYFAHGCKTETGADGKERPLIYNSIKARVVASFGMK